MDKAVLNFKFYFIFVFSLYFDFFGILNTTPSPFPSLTYTRSIVPLTIHKTCIYDVTTVSLISLACIIILLFFSDIERVNYRYISFDTRINMLQKSVDNRDSFHKPLLLIFLVIFYLVVFDSYVTLILIPSEFLDSSVLTKNVLKIARKCLELTYCLTTPYYKFVILIYSLPFTFLNYASSYTHEIIALWYLFLHLTLSCDIHPNPGPGYHATNFSGGFFIIL